MKSYIMYHCHSDYSLLDSCTKYTDYIDLAVRDGSRALSISEHGKPLNWTEKWAACKNAGLRYIHSVEIYLTESLDEKVRDNYHTVLMAKNMDGVRELNRLVSMSCDKEHFYYTNRLSFEEFLAMSDNIMSTSACLASPLWRLPEGHPMIERLLHKYTFLEVQGHNHPEQAKFNERLLRWSQQYGIPLIAGTDTHSSSKYKAECRAVLLSAKGKSYGDEDAFDLSYKTYDELVEMFKRQGVLSDTEIEDAIQNTNLLYGMSEDIELDTSIKYPILYGSRERDEEEFEKSVQAGLKEKIAAGIIKPEQVEGFNESITEEMRVFKKLGMTGFMLCQSELIKWCKSHGFAIGTARGSVGGSRIAYLTDIIDLNPEQWKTVFSRFANEDREEIGDIDIDCIESDRPAIFKYITDRFGNDKTARVASFGTLQAKGVIDDVGRHLAKKWKSLHEGDDANNPWSLKAIASIKNEYEADPDGTKAKYQELFYYFDGLFDTKISQSVHPAGMVISPVTLPDNYGVFDKEGDVCLMLDMENIHDFTGLAKYDFLVLKTVQVIRDTCKYIGVDYPQSHQIDWNDDEVWDNIITSPIALFQMEGAFAFESLKKYKPRNVFDLSLVTACIRPTGASYRDDLLARHQHKNPDEMIDKLFDDSNGFLVYQEQTIAFLQQICGLSGSEADNIRRAIGRKQYERLEKALPSILEGYCAKSSKPREEAEKDAKEFLQVIEDSASYQFGYNHSIAYSMLTYYCAYYRYHYPLQFITSFLNNAANDEDIVNGTAYANRIGISITMPKWGVSRADYSYDEERRCIAKGLASIKYISKSLPDELYNLANSRKFERFVDVLNALQTTSIDSRQLDILIKIDFFSEFGNQRELFRILEIYTNLFKSGAAKKIAKDKVNFPPLQEIVEKYSIGTTKNGAPAKSYTIVDVDSIMYEVEDAIKAVGMSDIDLVVKVQNVTEAMGYMGLITGREADRPKLYVQSVFTLKRKKDGKQFGYSVVTKSIGSGKESRMTVMNRNLCDGVPPKQGDVILCKQWSFDGKYFEIIRYEKIVA